MSEVILETRNLSKKYKDKYALDNASVTLEKNHIYGFIGENGAGKSTFMKIISGLVNPTSGDYSLMGEDYPRTLRFRECWLVIRIRQPQIRL